MNMRRFFLAALAALVCFSMAAAEGYWTLNRDIYYHEVKNCGGEGARTPISQEAAQVFGKYPCPVCIETAGGQDMRAAVRGGTIVLRLPDSIMEEKEKLGVFGISGLQILEGSEAQRAIAQYLHGEDYQSFMTALRETGSAHGYAWTPEIIANYVGLVMSARHIGGDWYFALRPDVYDVSFDDKSIELPWLVNGYQLFMEGEALNIQIDQRSAEMMRTLELEIASGAEPVYTRKGRFSITVYHELDAHIAVFQEDGADADFLSDVELYIDGMDAGTALNGYMSGDMGVFCCVVTDGELALLQAGADVELRRPSLSEGADFMDSPYAAVRRGTGKLGVIDASGEFVIEAKYDEIGRPKAEIYPLSGQRPFFCYETKGQSLSVFDGESLELLCRVSGVSAASVDGYMNPAVFVTYSDTGEQLRSMMDGGILIDRPYGAPGSEILYDGRYRLLADGLPTRLVAGDGETSAYLTDNQGQRAFGENYRKITPLIWSGERGVFLAESYEGENQDVAFEAGKAYRGDGEDWRCGLIDENGDALTGMDYASVKAISATELIFTRADGEVEKMNPLDIDISSPEV